MSTVERGARGFISYGSRADSTIGKEAGVEILGSGGERCLRWEVVEIRVLVPGVLVLVGKMTDNGWYVLLTASIRFGSVPEDFKYI